MTIPLGEDGASSLPRQPRQPEQDSYMGFVKTCGHRCTLSYVDKCCSCMDMRPIPIPVIAEAEADPERMAEAERMAERMYPRYSDGMGWINNGGRTDGYVRTCPLQQREEWQTFHGVRSDVCSSVLVLSCLVLSCFVLSCLVLSCLVLFCLVLF